MLEQVQVLARKLARTPLSKELRAAGIKQLRVLALFGSYVNLLEAAGFTPQHKPQLRKRASRFRLAVVCGQCHKHSQPSFRREALWLQGEVEFSPCPFCHYPNPRGNVKLVSEDL